MPGRSGKVIFPLTTSMPRKRSLAMSRLPSRSAKSTAGESWAAAEQAHDVSVMQPTITFMSSARARLSIFHASRMPVHFISLMLMPV